MKRPRKVIIIGLLLLLGGAIVNVAVAWGCEFWCAGVASVNVGVPTNTNWHSSVYQNWAPSPTACGRVRSFGRTLIYLEATRDRERLLPTDTFHVAQLMVQAGMPCRSIEYEMHVMQSNIVIMRHQADAGEVPNWLVPADHIGRRIPSRPIWPGFAINTIFYAAIVWVVFFAPGRMRRTIRRKRGLCPACAYPIGTSPVCTECGGMLNSRTCMGLPPPATPAVEAERNT